MGGGAAWGQPVRPALAAAAGIAAGIALARFHGSSHGVAAALAVGGVLATGTSLVLLLRRRRQGGLLGWFGVSALFAAIGIVRHFDVTSPQGMPGHDLVGTGQTVVVDGIVAGPPEHRAGNRVRLPVLPRAVRNAATGPQRAPSFLGDCGKDTAPGTSPASATVLLTAPEEVAASLLPGDAVRFRTRLRPVVAFRNPGWRDTEAYFRSRGVEALASVSSADEFLVIGRGVAAGTFPMARLLATVRQRLEEHLARGSSGERLALLRALVLGDAGAPDRETVDAFATTGTAHLLSISGLHLGIVALLIFSLLRLLATRLPGLCCKIPARRMAALLAVPVVAAYTLLTGAHTPTVRSAVMAGAFLGGLGLGRDPDSTGALSLAAVVILGANPNALFEPSFQLSFAAVVSLAVLLPHLLDALGGRRPDPGWGRLRRAGWRVAAFMAVTVAATLGTLPLTALHFGRVTLLGPLANLLEVPLVTFGLLPVALAVLVLAPVPFLGDLLLGIADALAGVLLDLNDVLAGPGLGEVRVRALSAIALVPWYAGLALALAGRTARGRGGRIALYVSAAVLLAAFATAGWWVALGRGGDEVRVTFLDVGQGDATVVDLPTGEIVLVDAGGLEAGPDPGEAVVVPYLRSLGVRRIRTVVMTHGHPDHCGGLPAVLREFPVDEILRPGGPPASPAEEAVLTLAETLGIPVRTPAADAATLHIGPAEVAFLHPLPYEPGLSVNDNSLVTLVAIGEDRLLLTGDIEEAGEGVLLEEAAEAGLDLRAAFLKVGHHGSSRSATAPFLEAVGPLHAVISVGRGNRFGHPAPETLDRLHERGVRVWRTDRHGAVLVTARGEGLAVRTAVDGP